MRVLAICSYAGLGGCERSFAILLEHLPPSVRASALVVGEGPLPGELRRNGIPTASAPEFDPRPSARSVARFTRLLYPELRRERYDVVWGSGLKAAALAIPACRMAGVPFVWHKVDFSLDGSLGRPLALGSDAITAISDALLEPLGALGRRRRAGIVPPPMRPELRGASGPGEMTIGTLGRLVPYKGHHLVIEAAARLTPEFPDLRVVIAGGPVREYPDYPAKLRALAERLGLDGRVELPGFVEDVSTALSRLTVLVNPTHRDADGYGLEGRGRAILEASHCGIPVVATSAGGAAESVIDGVSGTLVDDADPGSLAGAISPYLRDPALAERTGRRGAEFARQVADPDRAAQLLREALATVVDRRHHQRRESTMEGPVNGSRNGHSPGALRARVAHPRAILLTPNDAAVAIARSLASRGVEVSMLAEGRGRGWKGGWANWPLATRAARGHSLGGLPEHRDEWLERLSELGRRDGVLISCSDRSTELLVHQRHLIPERLRSFESPTSAHLDVMDKGRLYELAEGAGVRIPWTIRLSSRADLEMARENATYPCVIKPTLSHLWRKLFGDKRVLFVRNADELVELAGPGLDAGLELLVNEFVPGPETNLENAVLVRAADGSFPLAYGHRRLRQYPPGFGAAAVTESANVPGAMELGRALLEGAGFVGLGSVLTKRDAETNESVLIEVNVRVPIHFGLGDASGADASWRLYASLAGIPVAPPPAQIGGIRSITPSLEPRAAAAYLSDGNLTPRQLLASYRGVRDLNGLSWRDPKPALTLGAQQLRGMASRLREAGPRRRPGPAAGRNGRPERDAEVQGDDGAEDRERALAR